MLVALYQEGNEKRRIEYEEFENILKQDPNARQKLKDPIFTDISVFPRASHLRKGNINVQGHFFSQYRGMKFPEDLIWDPEYFVGDKDHATRRESSEHLAGKTFIRDFLREFHAKDYAQAKFHLEFPIKIATGPNQGKRRIADIAAVFPCGYVIVHEIQLASITPDELQERTDDYFSSGCDVIWWLGKSAHTSGNEKWAKDNHLGNVYLLDFQEDEQIYTLYDGKEEAF